MFDRVFIEDLEAYKKGLDKRDFHFCNILSNRITMNAVFLKSKEFALVGAILKDFLPNFQRLDEEQENRARKDLVKIINTYIKNLERLDCFLILDKYSEYYDVFKQHFNSNFEKYTENKDYTLNVTNFCLEFLKNELEENLLPFSDNMLIAGVLNEISRTSQNFGCSSHQHILRLILSYFSKIQEYFKVLVLSDELKHKEWEKRYESYKIKLKTNIQDFELSETYIKKSLEDLFEFIMEWRFMFMRLMNIVPLMQQQQIKIPSRIENELKSMVSSAISKELEGEKK